MRYLSILCLFLITMPVVAGQEVPKERFKATVTFHNDSAPEVESMEMLETTRTTGYSQDGDYNITLENDTDTQFIGGVYVLFRMPTHNPDDPIETKSNVTREMFFPYNPDAETLRIQGEGYNESFELLDYLCQSNDVCTDYCSYHDAAVTACTCGDGTCQSHESEELCPQDCDPDFLDGEENDTDTTDPGDDETDPPVNPGIGGDDEGQRPLTSYLIGGIALLIGAGLLIWFMREVET